MAPRAAFRKLPDSCNPRRAEPDSHDRLGCICPGGSQKEGEVSIAVRTGSREKQRDSEMWVWWGGRVRGDTTLISQQRDVQKPTLRCLLVLREICGSTRQHAD